ncbi:unnamed protein product [Oikopleura dioica]|uniref:Uncharacterized protein n=1 Tax=Oikopleura dioica TaxID=34765 RepID=E4X1V2_OIKDI|nr:unnamed protein product [Oikopleura dioica]
MFIIDFFYKLPNLESKSTIVITRNKKLNRISDDVDVKRIFEAVSRKVNKMNMSNIKHWFFQTCYVLSNLLMNFKKISQSKPNSCSSDFIRCGMPGAISLRTL